MLDIPTLVADLRAYAAELRASPRDTSTQRAIANARAKTVEIIAGRIERGEPISSGAGAPGARRQTGS